MAKGEEWSREDDAIIMELLPKGRILSAHVRTGRSVDMLERRYAYLTTGKTKAKSRAQGLGHAMTEERREKIRAGNIRAQARARERREGTA